jgi:hypothetical protein
MAMAHSATTDTIDKVIQRRRRFGGVPDCCPAVWFGLPMVVDGTGCTLLFPQLNASVSNVCAIRSRVWNGS